MMIFIFGQNEHGTPTLMLQDGDREASFCPSPDWARDAQAKAEALLRDATENPCDSIPELGIGPDATAPGLRLVP